MRHADVQRWMVSAITGAEVDAANAAAYVIPNERMTAFERLDVYRSAYRARLIECLLDDYPVLAHALGEDAFESLCLGYMEKHPSTNPNLNFFGRHMASYCAEQKSAFEQELATLEWSLVEVLHAEAAKPLDPAALQAIPVDDWARALLVRSEAVRLHHFEYPVNAYFQAVRGDDLSPEIPTAKPGAVLVYRKDHAIWRQELQPVPAQIVGALLEGKTIGDALDPIEDDGTVGSNLMLWFKEWVEAGLFTRVELR